MYYNCDSTPIFIPINECNECSAFEARLEKFEEKLDGKKNVVIAGTDVNGNTVSVSVLGSVT